MVNSTSGASAACRACWIVTSTHVLARAATTTVVVCRFSCRREPVHKRRPARAGAIASAVADDAALGNAVDRHRAAKTQVLAERTGHTSACCVHADKPRGVSIAIRSLGLDTLLGQACVFLPVDLCTESRPAGQLLHAWSLNSAYWPGRHSVH